MHAISQLFILIFIEGLWKVILLTGASIRWLYLRKENSFRQILNSEGNGGVGLFVAIPVIAVAVLVYLNR